MHACLNLCCLEIFSFLSLVLGDAEVVESEDTVAVVWFKHIFSV